MTEDLRVLIHVRGTIKSRITMFTKYLNNVKTIDYNTITEIQIDEIQFKLDRFQSLMSQFDEIQGKIETLSSDFEEQMNEREIIEGNFSSLICQAKKFIESYYKLHKSGENDSENNSCSSKSPKPFNIKLPTIDLPQFDGNSLKWLEFRDTFNSLVNENDYIPEINKFHYLRSSLKDGASVVIKSISFSAENYKVAWEMICSRYDNTRLLVNNHLKSLFSFQPLTKESHQSLRYMIDYFTKNIRSLSVLNEPTDSWDTLIIFMMTNKLDAATSRKWEEHRNSLSDSPSLTDFYSFLRNRADVLETLQCNKFDNFKYERGSHSKDPKFTKSFVVSNKLSNNISCVICKGEHLLHNCDHFRNMSVETRLNEVAKLNLCANCLRPGHRPSRCFRQCCRLCKIKHNTLLHTESTDNCNTVTANEPSSSPGSEHGDDSESSEVSLSAVIPGPVLLCTAQVDVFDPILKKYISVKALLDNGSQSSFVSQHLQEKINLRVSENNSPIKICGINNNISTASQQCNLKIKSRVNSFSINVPCHVIPQITTNLPSVELNTSTLDLPLHIELADPSFFSPSKIDILLGADVFWEIVCNQQIRLGRNKPTLQESELGWLISGPTGVGLLSHNRACHFTHNIETSLSRFWEIEELPSIDKKYFTKVEELCEGIFLKNVKRNEEGRFSVKIPLIESPEGALGDSYNIAKCRFLNLEKKFKKHPLLREQYKSFIDEYERLGHLSPIKRPLFGNYLPHHAVIRNHSETTKLRVVFDASCKTTSGKSFNDIQLVGPVVQDDLFSILVRFRQNAFVVTGDIEKMYRQIEVDCSQRHLQLILWRDNEGQPLKVLQLNTVTYGTASAPFLSTRCLLQLSEECRDNSDVANIIEHDFYIDDLITGSNSKRDLQCNVNQVINKLSEACFPLRKFRTNVPDIGGAISTTDDGQDFCKESTVLGLNWSPKSDTLRFLTTIDADSKITKRNILSTSSKLFDPLGLLSATTIIPKILLQRLWLLKNGWDDPIPNKIAAEWQEFLSNLHALSTLEIPRHVACKAPSYIELHCFTDASQIAYAACLYLKSIDKVGKVTVHLFCAKTKVAPIKPELTIPRLELMGALLGARLLVKVVKSLRFKNYDIARCVLWTDSTIVLGWINSEPKTLKVFVCNRIENIRELTAKHVWRHVPTQDNPADLASRGVRPQHLKDNQLWWHGAPFLLRSEEYWPVYNHVTTTLPETRVSLNLHVEENSSFNIFLNCSNFYKMQRIFAYVLRFIENCKSKAVKKIGNLTVQDLNNSLFTLAKIAQQESFKEDINSLDKKGYVNRKSRIISLNPFLDNDRILRVGGRIQRALVPYNKKHPIIIDSKHPFTKLLFKREHVRLLHCGPTQLLSLVREEFWPIGGRVLATRTVKDCVQCSKIKGTKLQQIMGNLPFSRVNPAPPFETCGTDFAGPFLISNRKGRGAKSSKCYLCIFVCFATKAVHLEVVSELSTNAFILCLRRFISRRGKPRTIYCDNGTNFVGANNELGRMLKAANGSVTDFGVSEGIDFKFSPAYAPHFGGIWEAGVKSAKFHLRRILGVGSSLTFEELCTLFSQIEAILNSRPLTPLSADPSDFTPLTPGHFLIGRPLSSLPSPTTSKISINRYQQLERLRQHFWSRWSREFLSELQQRVKWNQSNGTEIMIGDMVVVKDEQPPMKWVLGRIKALHTGPDGKCRVVDVATSKGVITRALNKICYLPKTDSNQDLETPSFKEGSNVNDV